jgi:thioesterase domain-containing protein
MGQSPILSAAKRALLERYLRPDLTPAAMIPDASAPASDEEATSRERVVCVQTGGSERPFFFLHGQWQTGGFFCFRMARALGPDRPFYALEPYRFEGLAVPPRLQAIAAAHLKSLRRVQPQGPYLLGGWCNGALLAYEIACQLHADGQRVEQLVLMDPVYLRYPARLKLVRGAISGLGGLLRAGEERQLRLYLGMRQVYRRLDHLLTYFRSADYRKSASLTHLDREDYPGVYDWAAMDYAPDNPYPAKITFFWSATQPFRRGWREIEVANEVDVHTMPCLHTTCLNVYLEELGDRLRPCLAPASISSAARLD